MLVCYEVLFWRDVRAVDGAVLERLCTERYRGFESPSLRSVSFFMQALSMSPGPMQGTFSNPVRSGRKQR